MIQYVAYRSPPAGGYTFTNSEAAAVVAAFSVEPDDTRKALIDDAVGALKTAGVWSKHSLLYVHAAHHEQAGRINWKSPGSFTLTAVNSPTFTTDRGFTGNNSTMYLDTGWDPSNNGGGIFQQNSAHIGAYVLTGTTGAGNTFGQVSGTASLSMWAFYTPLTPAYKHGGWINSTGQISASSATNAPGHAALDRPSSTGRLIYQNGSLHTTAANQASAALISIDLTILRDTNGYANNQIAIAHCGASLSATDYGNLKSAFDTYLTAVGAI